MRCLCPELTAAEFQDLDLKEIDLSGKMFYVSKIPVISHFPLNRELKTEKVLSEIEKKGYKLAAPLFSLVEDGFFTGNLLIQLADADPKDNKVKVFSNFKLIGKVYDDAAHLLPKALKNFDRYLMSRKIMATSFYYWFHSCKVCEKGRGSKAVIFGGFR